MVAIAFVGGNELSLLKQYKNSQIKKRCEYCHWVFDSITELEQHKEKIHKTEIFNYERSITEHIN